MADVQSYSIAGAGLAGSLMALLLARRGHQVELFERRPDPRGGRMDAGRSINLALSTRGIAALRRAGILDRVMEMALPMSGRMLHAPDGALSFIPYGKDGEAIYSVSRAGLNLALLQAADAHDHVNLHFEHALSGWDVEDEQLHFDTPTGPQTRPLTTLLATDGAWSAARWQVMRRQRFSYEQRFIEHAYKELHLAPGADGQFQLDPGALHIWPRGDFMLIALPNPDRTFTLTLFLDHDGPDVSFEALPTPQSARAFFDEQFGDVSALLPDLESQWLDNPTSNLHYVKCWPWLHDDRVLLLGDAAHAIVPFYGQGMNAAFEDCYLLDTALAEASGSDVETSRLLGDFAAERKPAADAICDLAMYNFLEMRSRVADPGFVERKLLESTLMELFPETYRDLYGLVTFSTVPYHEARERAARQSRTLTEHPESALALLTLGWLRRLAGDA